jgi:1-acyl-sn-glycerol-3-phosphate acyltransferase
MGLVDDVKLMSRGRDWRGRARTPRSAELWRLPQERSAFATGWARTPLANAVRLGLQRGILKPVAWSQTRPVVEGLEYLDGVSGPVIFVANHSSHLDTPLILGSMPRRFARKVAVGAASDYFFDVRWRALVTALIFNAFPVERHGANRPKSIVSMLLDRGWSLLLFPESSRSQDGWMSSFRVGSAHLCCSRGIPAVPVALRGTFAAMPRGRTWPIPGRPTVVVRYGRPLWPDEGEGARDFNQRLTTAVSRLWAEEDLGWYASLRVEPKAVVGLPTGPRGSSWRRVWESSRPLPDTDTREVWPTRPR